MCSYKTVPNYAQTNRASYTLVSPFVLAQGGGSLGGNPSVDTGAVNVIVGKCTQYKMDAKATQQEGKDVATIIVPESCETINDK